MKRSSSNLMLPPRHRVGLAAGFLFARKAHPKPTAPLGTRQLDSLKFLSSWITNGVVVVTFCGAVILPLAAFVVALVPQTVVQVGPISVPKVLSDRGYTNELVAERLVLELNKVVRSSNSNPTNVSLAPKRLDLEFGRPTKFNPKIPGTDYFFQDFVEFFRNLMNRSMPEIRGEVTCGDANCTAVDVRITLRSSDTRVLKTAIDVTGQNTIDALIRRTAEGLAAKTDPYRVANHLAAEGQPVRARQLARAIIANHDPGRKWAMNLLGFLAKRIGDLDEAQRWFERALTLDTNFVVAQSNLGTVFVDRSDAKTAVPACRRAIELAGEYPPAHNCLGAAFFLNKERRNEALASFQSAAELDPVQPQYRINMGVTLFQLKKMDASLAQFKKAIALDPSNPDTHLMLAHVLDQTDQPKAAIEEFRTATEVAPGNTEAFERLGIALEKSKQFGEAAKAFRDAIAVIERNSDGQSKEDIKITLARLHYRLAEVLKSNGLPEDAIKSFERSKELGLDPERLEQANKQLEALRSAPE